MVIKVISLKVYGSSSKGNCFKLSSATTNVLLDAGIGKDNVIKDIKNLNGILITHAHLDHCGGVKTIKDYYKKQFYANETVLNILPIIDNQKFLIKDGVPFEINDFKIVPFEVYHDTLNYNFLIKDMKSGIKILYIIDTSDISNLHFNDIDIFIIEANHSYEWLEEKEELDFKDYRTYGNQGHLAVEDTIEFLKQNINHNTKKVILTHISSSCEDYKQIENMVIDGLNNKNIEVIAINPHLKEPLEIVLKEDIGGYDFE